MKQKNNVLWFLAEITFTPDEKIHIEHVVLRLYDVHYGYSYLYENPKLLENNRIFATIKEDGDIRIHQKDEKEMNGISNDWIGALNLEVDYENPEALLPYCDDYVPFGEYGKVYYEYE
jgi:hypothetical protein